MPDLADFVDSLKRIWDTRCLTNNGEFHHQLEAKIAREIGVGHISLCCNGTVALLLALRALGVDRGDAITTPFTFPATVHALELSGFRPVFCDIDPQTLNLDPKRVEDCIDQRTRLVLPVHVYGTPCDVEAFAEIGQRYELPVLYDAAHAFGVQHNGRSLLRWGDMSTLSFHATKLFSTIEGGAVVSKSAERKRDIDLLKNFGIADEETVVGPGFNGKMNEIQAAFGLLQLSNLSREVQARGLVASEYRRILEGVPGLRMIPRPKEVTTNYAYFPILIDERSFGMSRDRLHECLRRMNVITRKYFYPLCSRYPCYRGLPSSQPENLKVAEDAAMSVLCLPIFGTLTPRQAGRVGETIKLVSAAAKK
jgi:dTDP-4-amino-4,6-dideoxygalactose transaminase